MRLPAACAVLLLAAPLALRPATDDALAAPTLRGFDPASQAQEIKWEQQARALPDAARIGEFIRKFSSQAHLAGTPQSKSVAEGILAQLREAGLDASIERFEALLPTPKSRTLEITAPVKLRLKLDEPPIAGDPGSNTAGMVPPYNAYSADGNITAPLVYANFGQPEDYAVLATHGIDVKGKIVLVRYGRSFRGTKPKVAYEHGAVGCIIYSDPRDDGFYQGDAYPKGPWRPADAVQRGSVLDLPLYPGDPLSPGWASEAGSKRLSISEAQTIMKIPVLPISWADAQPLLANLTGPLAPDSWRGSIPVTYHLGAVGTDAHSTMVHMAVSMDNSTHPLYDVIARIPGSEFPDQWILDGNHHDAWVHGASDPLSGAAPLMETARALAALTRSGWKPRRTILLAFWDGEEFGLAGSTEWAEKHADELDHKLVAYINADSSGQGRLNIGGSHSLEAFAQEITRDVNDPVSGKPLEGALQNGQNKEFRISPLGSGSDYTPFLQHLGVATLDMRFASEDGGVYHSDYDDYNWYSRFGDPGFIHGPALSQLHLTALMRFADSAILPFEFDRLAATLRRFTDEIDRLQSQGRKPDLTAVRSEIARVQKASAELNAAWMHAVPALSGAAPDKLAAVNQVLFGTERAFIRDPGLPGRPWYRHRIYAPGVYTGYAAKTMPGIREAVEAGKSDEAASEAAQMVQVLHSLGDRVNEAAGLLSQL
jgi:N-acetylated-alpha-linked acidic dipeptidase